MNDEFACTHCHGSCYAAYVQLCHTCGGSGVNASAILARHDPHDAPPQDPSLFDVLERPIAQQST